MKAAIEMELNTTMHVVRESDLQALVTLAKVFPDRPIRVILNNHSVTDVPRYRGYYNAHEKHRTWYPFDIEDIVFEDVLEADTVRENMLEIIDQYGVVTVADLYDMTDLTAPYTATKYGWTDLSDENVHIVRVRDGYILKLPTPLPLVYEPKQ